MLSLEPGEVFSFVPSAGVGACQATMSAPGRADAVLARTANTKREREREREKRAGHTPMSPNASHEPGGNKPVILG